MKFGSKVQVAAILKKTLKYFSIDEYENFNASKEDKKFGQYMKLYSYDEHKKLIDEGFEITKDVFEKKKINKIGIVVGKRRMAVKRTFSYYTPYNPYREEEEEDQLQIESEIGEVYLVALNMNHIARVLEEDISILK